ncbi:LamG-like jellyroll fold domain-containing protein [Gracilibacillus oryzae]|uniref:LamG-like jellyroll fold domain-containing protein n=1 Tax=Gracilibacillus oryzae TaxID=1672701 RepID=UPI002B1BCE76|nr:LamG-like jellyroll fold domain-containing protein [Gracilibacillus oryzae]
MSDNGVVIWGSKTESKSNQEIVEGIKQELSDAIPANVISNISLPTLATQGAEISWESSHPEVISSGGVVDRASAIIGDVEVELTATITLGDVTEAVSITVTVPTQQEGGLSAYYDFNDSLSDQSGNQEDATITGDRLNNTGGNITFAEGIAGKAAQFDGESGIRLADGLITSDKYSISLWMKPEEITQFTTTFFGTRTENNWISLVPNADGVSRVWSYNGSDWYDANLDFMIPTEEWTHFTFTVDQGEAKIYINGQEEFSQGNFPNIFTASNAQFGLGVNFWDMPFKGLMDELRVYDGLVLTTEDVQSLFNNPGDGGDLGNNEQTNTENDLPETATNQFNLLAIGLLIMAAGASIFFIVRRRKNND